MDDATSRTLYEGKESDSAWSSFCVCWHHIVAGPISLFVVQVYQDLCKKHPTFRERSENADLAVRPSPCWHERQQDAHVVHELTANTAAGNCTASDSTCNNHHCCKIIIVALCQLSSCPQYKACHVVLSNIHSACVPAEVIYW